MNDRRSRCIRRKALGEDVRLRDEGNHSARVYRATKTLRRRRGTSPQLTRSSNSLTLTTRSGTCVCLDKRMAGPQLQAVRRRSSLGRRLYPFVRNEWSSAARWRAGARILRTSSNPIFSYTLLSALIATQFTISLLQKAPTPAKGSNRADG